MKYLLYIFLLSGFIIAIIDIIKYKYYLHTINEFEKHILIFKSIISDENINISKVDELLKLLLEKYPFYIRSNIEIVYVPNYFLNKNILITSHWLFNTDKYLNDVPGYSFDEFLNYINNTLKECSLSRGKNKVEVNKSYIKLIPIFYFRNCIEFFINQFSARNKEITQETNRWINFVDVISVFSGIVTIAGFFLQFFISKP